MVTGQIIRCGQPDVDFDRSWHVDDAREALISWLMASARVTVADYDESVERALLAEVQSQIADHGRAALCDTYARCDDGEAYRLDELADTLEIDLDAEVQP